VIVDRLARPLGSLRVSVTDRCNLRCRYCMPEQDYVWLPKYAFVMLEMAASSSRLRAAFVAFSTFSFSGDGFSAGFSIILGGILATVIVEHPAHVNAPLVGAGWNS
jgi:hypothetical protein